MSLKDFFSGMSKVANLSPNTRPVKKLPTTEDNMEADYLALSKDWEIIGQDIQDALDKYSENKD